MHCTGPVAVSTLSPTITFGAGASAALLVEVVAVLLDVEAALVDELSDVLLDVVVVVTLAEVDAVVVVVVVVAELTALAADDTGVSEALGGIGIDWVHAVMAAAATTPTTTIDRLPARLGSAIHSPCPLPRTTCVRTDYQ